MYQENNTKNKTVAIWLMIGVVMVIIQVLLGGITRLSGSGLSITEWNIVTGTLPPLNHQDWLTEFAKYQASPQFKNLNSDFTLSDFKFIFFWEWFHRFWARLLGFVFAIPFIYFLIKKYFTREMLMPIVGIFVLGGLQGAIGWIMVASGLEGDAIYVRPTRLALHFVFAMILGAYVFWFALKLIVPKNEKVAASGLHNLALSILLLLIVQFIYGALMAGHKAAPAAATWPTINGAWIPDGMSQSKSGHYLLENRITIHFIHRTLAYVLLLLTLIFSFKAARIKTSTVFNKYKFVPLIFIVLQVTLGIITVLTSHSIIPNRWQLFETIALTHQLVAMFFMLNVLLLYFLTQSTKGVAQIKS